MSETHPPAVERVLPPSLVTKIGNPILRRLLRSRLHRPVSEQLMLLHFVGRKTQRAYTVPVAYHDIDGGLAVLTNSGWRANFRGGVDAEVTLRGRRRPARLVLDENPDAVASVYAGMIAKVGRKDSRRLGIRINVDREPTHAELTEAVHASGLSVLHLQL